ncbi:ferredoxin [Psittacicella hinzii]|uniref:Ferredoxin n=1 Tax=Psittacicella hinzii TaxID=2028575 RepID=A0A3A1XZW6_9GAMM|nr:YfhL family 4Fe-4S dicluster ferredoxin [Psittacicella hinzii]RIY31592.1 ferredoxin [Psittacicella hinzii]
MALLITQKCTNCDMCLPECPNSAIYVGEEIYEIDPLLCTECVGFYDTPTCQACCPINKCIISDPNYVESQETLWEKFILIHHSDEL